jgi:hypothetical protein
MDEVVQIVGGLLIHAAYAAAKLGALNQRLRDEVKSRQPGSG